MEQRGGGDFATGSGANAPGPEKLFALRMRISPLAPLARDFYLGLIGFTGGKGVAVGAPAVDLFTGAKGVPGLSYGLPGTAAACSLDYALSPLRGFSLLPSAEEVVRSFREIARVLKPGGLLAFDLDNCCPEKTGEGTMRVIGAARLPNGAQGVISESRSALPGGRKTFCRLGLEELDGSGKVKFKSYHTLTLLTLSHNKVLDLARSAGFEAEGVFGGFKMELFDSSSPTQLWLFRKL
ncbi:hypothetical protein EPN96_00490 [bacterium]|nr:MAG: hypothetical protein EPN96_00490 [bacterium]